MCRRGIDVRTYCTVGERTPHGRPLRGVSPDDAGYADVVGAWTLDVRSP